MFYRWFILGLTALLLACGSAPGDDPAPAGPTWLARIGSQTVEAPEFQAYLEQQSRRNPRLQITPAVLGVNFSDVLGEGPKGQGS